MSGSVFELDQRLDLRAAGALAKALLAYRGADLTLDASAVRHFGALSVQVIHAAARSWAEDGHRLALTGASTDVVDQLDLLGFTPDTLTQWEACA